MKRLHSILASIHQNQMGNLGMNVILAMIGLVVVILFFPVVLDTMETILAENLSPYTGLEAIVKLTPLLAWVGAVLVACIMGFFSLKAKFGGKK